MKTNQQSINPGFTKLNSKMKEKQNLIKSFQTKVNSQIETIKSIQRSKTKRQWGIEIIQKRIENHSEINSQYVPQKPDETQPQQDTFLMTNKNAWQYPKSKDLMRVNVCNSNKYYPPSCSGYDISYCKLQNTIYLYGGISCDTILEEGIRSFFYKLSKDKWTEVKPDSIYCPIPRYGHTLTCYQRDLILFGGVSQYKEKLKDRCFYSDISLYSTQKNQWKILDTSGNFAKTRKNHAACMLGKFFFIFGGINENQQVIKDLSWISIEQRKPRWKSLHVEARFNHKMISIQMKGKDFLAFFGGRNENSQIINSLSLIPLTQVEGEIVLKDPIKLSHQMSAREMPMMQRFSQGFIIFGGNNVDNEVVSDSWYYHAQKQYFQKLQLALDFKQLRGCQGVSTSAQKMYIMGCNSKKYKAIEIELEK